MSDDDDDPVIREIPVYLCKLLEEKLFLFHFPVRPVSLGHDNCNVIKSCIKPNHQEVKMELELDTQSPNFDTSKGEQIALNVDGSFNPKGGEGKKFEERYFQNVVMDKQLLVSNRAIPDTSQYAALLIKDNEIHVTSVKGVVHMRPSFDYLDASDKKAKEDAKETGEGDASGEEDEEAKQVTVRFARQENDRIKKARERSFGYLSKKSAEEPWYHTNFHNVFSELSEQFKNKLFCPNISEYVSELSMPSKEYLQILAPSDEKDCIGLQENVIPLSKLRKKPLLEQLKRLFLEAIILQFSQVISILNLEHDKVNVLRVVQQVAVLVRGNWIIKSDVLYPAESFSPVSGVPAELMCRARDYILHSFTQKRTLNRLELAADVKLSSEEVKGILDQIGKLRADKRWELKLPFDNDFVVRHPEVVQRQKMMWEAKHKQLIQALNSMASPPPNKVRRRSHRDSSCGSDSDIGNENKLFQGSPKRQGKVRRKSHRDSLSSDNESGVETGASHKLNNCSPMKVARRTNAQQPIQIKVEPMET